MRARLIVLLCVTVGSSTFPIGAFPAVLPDLDRAGFATAELGTLVAVFGFARMIVDVPVGLVIERRLRWALIGAPVVLAAALLAIVSGDGFGALFLGRALMGVAHALGMIGWLTTILRHERGALGTALNAFEFSAMVGMLGGIAIVGALPKSWSWKLALLVASGPQFIALGAVPFILASLPPAGSVARARVAPLAPDVSVAREPWSPAVLLAFAAGTAIALTYATVELFMIPLRASREFGLGRAGAAQLLILAQVTDMVFLLPAGVLADRIGAPPVLALALVVFACASLLVGHGGLVVMAIGAALCGVAMAGWMLPLALLRRDTRPANVAWRTAVYRVGVDGGLFVGPFVSGVIGDWVRVLPALFAAMLVAIATLVLVGPPQRAWSR